MKNIVKIVVCSILISIILMMSNCFAAWWGTPGYEWALSKGLTSMKTQAQLNRDVTVSDYYTIILKYLKMKGIEYNPNRVVQNFYTDELYNGSIKGLVSDINSRIGVQVESLTPQQYRVLADLTDHGKQLIQEHSENLYRDDLKALNLYFDLAKYRGALLLSEKTKMERAYKNNVLFELRNTKYAESLKYGIMPISGADISRRSFLVLMHNLLSNTTSSDADSITNSFRNSGVLIGFDDGLMWLQKNLRYSEMFAFLYRFEAYDFSGPSTTTSSTSSSIEDIVDMTDSEE